MLPSTGLFKCLPCPFYESKSCVRPFCHFKHSKREEHVAPVKKPAQAAVYNATPKFLLAGSTGQSEPASEKPPAKKPKLEYIPKPASSKTKLAYVPSPVPAPIQPELSESIDVVEKRPEPEEPVLKPTENGAPANGIATIAKRSEDQPLPKEKEKSSSSDRSKSSDRHHHRTSKSLSSSSSSRDKHKSSSSSSSSSKSHSHSSSKSSHRSHSGRSSSKSSSSSRHSSSHRHSSSRKSSPRDKESPKIKNIDSVKKAPPSPDPSLCLSDSDEDDIMAQCRMIFEEYSTPAPAADGNSVTDNDTSKAIVQPYDMYANDEAFSDATKKKRVAYDNAKTLLEPVNRRTQKNHVQNALQAQHARRLTQPQLEFVSPPPPPPPAPTPPSAPATNGVNSVENGDPTQPMAIANPTVANSTQFKLPGRSIAPVSNIIALQNAKKKIEMMRMAKQALHNPQTPAQTAAKTGRRIAHAATAPPPTKNDAKPSPPVLEPNCTKISYNLRMQYYNMMIKHCLNIYPNCEDAWDRAQTEELAVLRKCHSPVIYKSSALLAVNKLRKESIEAGNVGTEKSNFVSHDVILAGKLGQKTSWSVNKKIRSDSASTNLLDNVSSSKAYELILECILTEEQLIANGYPRAKNDDEPGKAVIAKAQPIRPPNDLMRYCCRCTKLYSLDVYDEPAVDQCNYHPKGTGFRRGFADNFHRCCQQTAGTAGCMYANYHCTDYADYRNLSGYVTTISRDDDYIPSKKDIFALDCEMCYTTGGLELTRITVVDFNEKVVYDSLVRPDNKIVDYNTIYSGITEEMMENEFRSLRDVQAVLLSMFHDKTILIGHSLESDLRALKIIHSTIVDTSVLYPHKMGPPKKRALKTLCIENLRKIIQENEGGHNSAEDAEVCIQLLKHYLRNRII